MPIAIKKVGNKYKVVNTKTRQIHAKGTTKIKAEHQKKLLDYLDKLPSKA